MKISRVDNFNSFQRKITPSSVFRATQFQGKFKDRKDEFIYNFRNYIHKNDKVKPDIKFVTQTTIEDAEKFAKENLGIDYIYDLSDLEVANYVNEALCAYYNAKDDKTVTIRGIVSFKSENLFMGMSPKYPVLMVSEDSFKTLDEMLINSFREIAFDDNTILYDYDNAYAYKMADSIKPLFKKYKSDPNSLSMKEKVNLSVYLRDVKAFGILGLNARLFNVTQQEGSINYLKSLGLDIDRDLITFMPKEGKEALLTLLAKGDYKIKINDSGPFGIVFHEMAHKLHENNMGYKRYLDTSFFFDKKTVEEKKEIEKSYEAMRQFALKEPDWVYTTQVSGYAATSPCEFVAETYAHMLNGETFSDEVMELYYKYEGIDI